MPVITSVADLRELARRRVPRMFFDFPDAGSWTRGTLRANLDDLQAIKLRQRVEVPIGNRPLRTQMAGQEVMMPVALSPAGLTAMQHAEGEMLAARATKAFGVPLTLSTMSICSKEDVSQAVGGHPLWFQLYVMKDRAFVESLIDRAKARGRTALMVTLDAQLVGQRNQDIRNIDGMAEWAASQHNADLKWSDIAWIKRRWGGKLILKGILDADDARLAVSCGADALVVFNHGGH